jgi:hypothetical protein
VSRALAVNNGLEHPPVALSHGTVFGGLTTWWDLTPRRSMCSAAEPPPRGVIFQAFTAISGLFLGSWPMIASRVSSGVTLPPTAWWGARLAAAPGCLWSMPD